ncbi:tumor necrosis factor receptor superfamily member 18 isoform X2 [Hippocampus zosterae]|uniref:tumor necrosis factor receptor superfamily member 18 isoform X2 n=1 Tax=Hippocampus zosterae TaxID=109293 RepID=UPI00223CD3D6|nr:tumor necrosis factor receptor superfamily member 18 isoform X2 [Hippocampus zosterae]
MVSLHCSLAALYALCIWIVKYAAGTICSDSRTTLINGRCCKLCPPGQYLEGFCTETTETVCRQCPDNFFSQQYNAFNKCMPCQSCQGAHREYEEKCSSTTNAKCLCHPGFLCSDDACSQCVENMCDDGEKAVKTGPKPYKCQPCRDDEYLDVKMNICRPRRNCSKEGLVVQFPGNKTHNAVCRRQAEVRLDSSPERDVYMILGIGCGVLVLILLVTLSHISVTKKCRAGDSLYRRPVEEIGDGTHCNLNSKEP